MFLFEVFGLMLIIFVDLDALYIDFVKRKNSIITSFMNISHASLLILFSFSKVFKGLFHFQFSQENITQQIKKKKEYDLPTTTSLENGVQVFAKQSIHISLPLPLCKKNANKKEYCMK
jgi:hypothetical protein